MKKLVVLLAVLSLCLIVSYKFRTEAESLPTNLTVGNSPPSFTAGPVSDPVNGSWINEGQDITFTATANDPNGESYYMAICSGTITPGSGGSAPSCDGTTYCTSSLTASDSEASCYKTIDDTVPISTTWFAYACDNNTSSSECSSFSSGSFYANHDPSFTAVSDDGGSGSNSGADPGGTMTFTATASDSDDIGIPDKVMVVVCGDTSGADHTGCTGTQLCISGMSSSNPSCQYSIPSVAQDGDFNYYAYVFDNYGDLGSFSNYRSGTYEINNVAPTVSAVTINGGSNIDLTENTTTDVIVTGTVTDNNSCQDLVTVEASVYRSGVTYTGCDTNAEDDDDSCYAQVSCSVSGGSCTGLTDASANYTCTIPLQYHADPTVSNTEYPTENWLSTINAVDSALSDNTQVVSGVEMNGLNAIDLGSTLNYGSHDVGYTPYYMETSLSMVPTGNIGVDMEFSGTNMTDGGSGVINASQQKFIPYCSSEVYSNKGETLTSTATEYEVDLAKATDSNDESAFIYWGLAIPTEIPPGTYTGTNTITSVWSEVGDWGGTYHGCTAQPP